MSEANRLADEDFEFEQAEREHMLYAKAQKWFNYVVAILLPSAVVGLWCLVWWLL